MHSDEKASIEQNLLEIQRELCEKLKVTPSQLSDILEGRSIVERVLFKEEHFFPANPYPHRILLYAKRLLVLVLLLLLGTCIFVNGFADNIREHLLRIIPGYQSMQVETIQYGQIQDLEGAILPMVLPAGYKYRTHTQPANSNLFLVEYSNSESSTIEYYYYPPRRLFSPGQ